jgi:hypothetical protein
MYQITAKFTALGVRVYRLDNWDQAIAVWRCLHNQVLHSGDRGPWFLSAIEQV